jgi:arylsulfatase
MAEAPTDVLVAGYPDTAGATTHFGSLGAARQGHAGLDGRRDPGDARPDGSVAVRQTCGHLGREGLGRGGGAGLAVGLFAPPLLASVAVGGCRGRGHRRVRRPPRRAGHSDS